MKSIEEIEGIISKVEYPNFKYNVFLDKYDDDDRDGHRPILQISCVDTCSVSGEEYRWKGRKWFLSPHMTQSEIVQTAFLATHVAMEHELRERFKYRGQPIFRPHYSVDALHALCLGDVVDRRE